MPDYYYNRLIDNLIEIRKNKGFTQKMLAETCGLTQSVIARIESKKSIPTMATLCKILYSLDATIQFVDISATPA